MSKTKESKVKYVAGEGSPAVDEMVFHKDRLAELLYICAPPRKDAHVQFAGGAMATVAYDALVPAVRCSAGDLWISVDAEGAYVVTAHKREGAKLFRAVDVEPEAVAARQEAAQVQREIAEHGGF